MRLLGGDERYFRRRYRHCVQRRIGYLDPRYWLLPRLPRSLGPVVPLGGAGRAAGRLTSPKWRCRHLGKPTQLLWLGPLPLCGETGRVWSHANVERPRPTTHDGAHVSITCQDDNRSLYDTCIPSYRQVGYPAALGKFAIVHQGRLATSP
jgi:hypothetical protein